MPKRTQTRLTKRTIDDATPGSLVWDTGVPGFGVRVTPAGAKSFIFQFRAHSGEQGKITIGRYPAITVDEARKMARDHRLTVDKGGNPSRNKRNLRESPTLSDLADHYCGEYALAKSLNLNTVRDARRLLDRFVIPKFGRRNVQDVTVADIRKIHGEARRQASAYQANRLRAFLSRMFSLAIQDDLRTDNPCKGVEKFAEDQRWTYLNPDQVDKLLAACSRLPDQNAANAVRLLLFTGARLQEVLKAEWSEFDLERGVWEKPSHHTKTKIRHHLPLAKSVVNMLGAMRSEDPEGKYLFAGRRQGTPRTTLKRPWTAILEDAGLEGFRQHDLRRTKATFMLSSGSGLPEVGKSLGHTQASTTARYAQLFGEVQRDGVDRAVNLMLRV